MFWYFSTSSSKSSQRCPASTRGLQRGGAQWAGGETLRRSRGPPDDQAHLVDYNPWHFNHTCDTIRAMPSRATESRRPPGRPSGTKTFDVDSATAFGAVVCQERLAIGVSQEALAAMANMDRSGLSKIERGRNQPSLQAILNLARALGHEPATLLDMTMAKLRRVKL